MIAPRRSNDRVCDRHGEQNVWLTFNPQSPENHGFGALEMLNEHHLPPGAPVVRHGHGDVEIITYVREGSIAYQDSLGRSGVIHAGEFQRLTAGRRVRHGATNASSTEWAHVFQMQFRPSQVELTTDREQKRFSAGDRRDRLRIVASPDTRRGSLQIHQDALIFSALLEPGQHVVHELSSARSAWLHVVRGELALADLIVLTAGDGAGLTAERSVSFTSTDDSEILLVDLANPTAA